MRDETTRVASDNGPPARGTDPYAAIRRSILDGGFASEDVLLETKLAAMFEVSRTPIREALARLAQEGLLDRVARGFRVRRSSPEELISIYETRITLETEIAALAAERHTVVDAVRLRQLEEAVAATDDPDTLHALSGDWHRSLRAAGQNPTMNEFLETLDTRIRLHDVHHQDNERQIITANLEEHSRIVEAVLARDANAAREHMGTHMRRIRDVRVAVLLRRHEPL